MTPDRAVLLGKAGAMMPSTRKMLYERPSVDRPNRLTIRCPTRVPRPHLTTERATRNARTMRRIVPLAKPAYAFAGDSRPVSTLAATARTDAVRMEKALTTTETMAAAKIANRRHAGTVSPSGGGTNHMTTTMATIAARRIVRRPAAPVAVTAVRPRSRGAGPGDRQRVPARRLRPLRRRTAR